MAVSLQSLVESAWASLWNQAGPYDLPSAIRQGRRVGLVFVRGADSVSFPETGRIVLMNREPWGAVSINLTNNSVSQLDTIVNEGAEFKAGTGTFIGRIRFTELKYTGTYTLSRGQATASALRLASNSLSLGDTDGNIALAKQYQDELITTDNGRYMVGTYYDHNQAYCQAFTNQRFVFYYQSYEVHPGSGKNTAYFANQTANAASQQNRGSVAVNQDPDYSLHSFAIQNFVMATCYSQKNDKAACAASNFKDNVNNQNPSTPQTVNQVMSTVATASRPNPTDCSQSQTVNGFATVEAVKRRVIPPRIPGWTAEIQSRVEAICKEIEQEEDDIRSGIKLRENSAAPIEGNFRAYVSTSVLTITGNAKRDEKTGESAIEFTTLTGPNPEVNISLSVFPGQLHSPVQDALGKANFLKALLGKKMISALGEPTFLKYISRLMALAMGEKLGPMSAK